MRLALPTIALLLAPAAALAQPAPPLGPNMAQLDALMARMGAAKGVDLTLSVSEPIEAEPDLAIVSGGVTTLAPTATEALRRNSEEMERVIAAVRRAGIPAADVQTQGIGLNPQYDYSGRQDGEPPRFTGYQATNTVQLRVSDVARVGPILDALVTAGATNLSGPDYTLENAAELEQAARLRTLATAQARADAYARAAGLGGARLATISEGGSPPPSPLPMVRSQRADAVAAPPTAPGRVRSEVAVTYGFVLGR